MKNEKCKIEPAMLDELVRRIREVIEPIRIILFGSAARGEMGKDSDLDVLVIVPEGRRRRDIAGDIYMNLIGFGQAVDVVVATEEDLKRFGNNFSLVYYPAIREGREIYAERSS